MKLPALVLSLLCTVSLCSALPTKIHQRDPLTDDETNQIRDVADEPAKKIALYVKFINARIDTVDHIRSDPKQAQGRGHRIHDLLEDFSSLSDEMGDNVDDAASKNVDLRKVLTDLVGSNNNWQRILNALKRAQEDPTPNPKLAAEAREYEFALADALEAANSNADTYPVLLQKQNVDIPKLEKAEKEREKEKQRKSE